VPQGVPQPLQLEGPQPVEVEPLRRVQQVRRLSHQDLPFTIPFRTTDHSVVDVGPQ